MYYPTPTPPPSRPTGFWSWYDRILASIDVLRRPPPAPPAALPPPAAPMPTWLVPAAIAVAALVMLRK
jgi:hypothetical protein